MWGGNYLKYCTTKCKDNFHSAKKKKSFNEKPCSICAKKFMPIMSTNKYCSFDCKKQFEATKRSNKLRSKECIICNKVYVPYTSMNKFCSADCRNENHKSKRTRRWSKESCERRKGKGNPAYVSDFNSKPNIIKNHKHREYLKVRNNKRKNKINENGYLYCDNCGISNTKFEMHHIVFRSEKPQHQYLHDERNLIDLCVLCHNGFHKDKPSRMPLIKDRGLTELFGNSILLLK